MARDGEQPGRINGVVPSGGICPTCGRPTDTGRLACRDCWQDVPAGLRGLMSQAWSGWHLGGSLAELRATQRRVMAAIEERRPRR